MSQVFLGVDVGTTGCKVVAIDELGNLLDSETVEYPIYTPRPGWTEQNPEDWWNAAKEAIKRITSRKRVSPELIQGVGLTGQMHGLVIIDSEDKVIRPAILWNDQRTFKEAEFFNDKFGLESVIKITGSIVQTGFTAPKLLWVKNNEPDNFEKIKKFMLPKDYVGFKLTGDIYTDVNDASGTSFFNVEKRRWAEDLITELEFSLKIFPEVLESNDVRGVVKREVAEKLGLKPDVVVVAGAGDQGAAGIGAGAVKEEIISVNLGTSGVVFTSSDKYRYDLKGRLHAFCHASPSKWHLMGVMLSAGGSLRWFRDNLCHLEKIMGNLIYEDPYNIIVREAINIPAGSEGLIFLPYLSGERTPHADPYARGVFFGLSLKHGKGHMVRSILEGVAYGLMNSLELMYEMGIRFNEVRLVGGGSRSLLWRKIVTDVFGLRTYLLKVDEGSSYGAAILAAVGVGAYKNVEDAVNTIIKTVEPIDPNLDDHEKYMKYYKLYGRLYEKLKDEFRILADIA
ncbi:MAG: xylulokinase [Aigarchaeota archaeon]|nr:xylulokinase [Aigarchaeota archaeon]